MNGMFKHEEEGSCGVRSDNQELLRLNRLELGLLKKESRISKIRNTQLAAKGWFKLVGPQTNISEEEVIKSFVDGYKTPLPHVKQHRRLLRLANIQITT